MVKPCQGKGKIMKKYLYIAVLALYLLLSQFFGQSTGIEKVTPPDSFTNSSEKKSSNEPDVCLSVEERKLLNLINQYRASKKLPAISASKSLTFVAQTHARDSQNNSPDKGNCNLHSWSGKGTWTSCCYTSDHRRAKCMWDKPRELTNYKGNGFEISSGASGFNMNAEAALKSWKGSSGHNNVIISHGMWKNPPWKAIGVGIYGGYAHVWFGHAADKEGNPENCK